MAAVGGHPFAPDGISDQQIGAPRCVGASDVHGGLERPGKMGGCGTMGGFGTAMPAKWERGVT